jgi:hypothetical protein
MSGRSHFRSVSIFLLLTSIAVSVNEIILWCHAFVSVGMILDAFECKDTVKRNYVEMALMSKALLTKKLLISLNQEVISFH